MLGYSDPLDVDRGNLFAQGFGYYGGGVSSSLPAASMLGIPGYRTYPLKSDFNDEKKWILAMGQYFIRKAIPIFQRRLSMNRFSTQMAITTTEFSKIPGYSRTPEGITQTPVEREFINTINPIINQLLGEFVQKPFDIKANCVNQEAFSRKNETLYGILLSQFFKGLEDDVREIAGLSLPNAEELLKVTKGNAIEYIKKHYKDVISESIEKMLNDWIQDSNFKQWLEQAYKLYLITDFVAATPYIDAETLQVKNPLIFTDRFIPDVSSLDNYFTNQKFFISYEYLPLESVMMRFPNLNLEDVKRFIGSRASFFGLPVAEQLDGRNYIVVVKIQFIYPEEIEISSNKESAESITVDLDFDELKESKEEEQTILKKRYEQLYYAYIIGGSLVGEHGVVPFQLRSRRDPSRVNLGSRVMVYDYFLDPSTPNRMTRMSALIKYRNIAFFKLVEFVSQLKGAYLEVDTKLIPHFSDSFSDSENFKTWWDQIQQNRLIFVNKSDSDFTRTNNDQAIKVVNVNGDNEQIRVLREAVLFYDQEIQRLMGVNAARTGNTGQYTTEGVARANLTASDYATYSNVSAFENFLENLLTDVANLLKISFIAKRDRAMEGDYSAAQSYQFDCMRYGDLAEMITTDLILEDIGIKIKRKDNQDQMKSDIREFLQIALQQKVDPQFLKIILHAYIQDNPSDMLASFDNIMNEYTRMQQEQAEQEAAQQQQNMLLNQQMNAQMQQDMLAKKQQGDQNLQNQKASQDLLLEKLKAIQANR